MENPFLGAPNHAIIWIFFIIDTISGNQNRKAGAGAQAAARRRAAHR